MPISSYSILKTNTRPSDDIPFFRMPEAHLTAVNTIINELGETHVNSRILVVGNKQIIQRIFADETAYQNFESRASANQDIVNARIAQAEYNHQNGITTDTQISVGMG